MFTHLFHTSRRAGLIESGNGEMRIKAKKAEGRYRLYEEFAIFVTVKEK